MNQSNTTPAANSAPLTLPSSSAPLALPAPPAPSAPPPSFALPLYCLIKQNRDFPTKAEEAWLRRLNPAVNAKYPWNDVGNARLFADYVKATARYVLERKQWYIYDGRVWKPDIGGFKVMEMCKRLAQTLDGYALQKGVKEYVNFVHNWYQLRCRKAILSDAASVYPVSYSSFDCDPFLFNCLNGTLNIAAGKFSPHNPDDMLTKLAGAEYDRTAACPRWERFVDEVTQGDKELAAYIQKTLGYALTGDTSEECFFFLFGPKSRNGKSTMMETYMQIMGDYGKTAKADTIAQRQFANGSGPNEDLARLVGARLVNIPEPDKQLVLSAATVKTLTGNDTIVARYLHENSFEYRPQFKLFINTNHLPRVTDNTVFTSDRVKVIPFNRYFSENERDKSLKSTLTQPKNLSGILNWCVEGYSLFKKNGLDCPQSVLDATAQYRIDNDKYARFIQEKMEAGPGFEVKTSDAYNSFQSWCVANGFKAGSIQSFSQEMDKLLTLERKRPKGGGEKTTVICGQQLKLF